MSLRCYAGIGTRDATVGELLTVNTIASELAKKRWICYSGNAPGCDQQFQKGSAGQCVLMLPWAGFEHDNYGITECLASFVCGETRAGAQSMQKFHPAPERLTQAGKKLICRNAHQIRGIGKWPEVCMVVCCATPTAHNGVEGGTGHAVRIANSLGIPVINIRAKGWQDELVEAAHIILPT